MKPFTYVRASSVEEAVRAHGKVANSRYIGGGTNLLDLMKVGVETPAQLIDISRLPLNEVVESEGGVRIGALVSNADAANHELIRARYPLLSEAILAGASPQLRNMATMGGNLLQRTRCSYFYDPSFAECNKRNPGSGCAARHGINRMHAILGGSVDCIATHPSDMCVALAALDAVVRVSGVRGERRIAMGEFHRLPGTTPQFDNSLSLGELITAIELPAASANKRSHYVKVRDRNSYAFALVSVAAVVDLDTAGKVREARVGLGGVSHKPWRAHTAEKLLQGRTLERRHIEDAANSELKVARASTQNAFKVELVKRAMVRALTIAATREAA